MANPTLTFCRGSTYTFSVSAPGHPFYIKTVKSIGSANAYESGVTGNGTESGNVTFVVPTNAPDTLFSGRRDSRTRMSAAINVLP